MIKIQVPEEDSWDFVGRFCSDDKMAEFEDK
jgi:hypothetical protein